MAVTTSAEAVKPKYGGNFSAVMPYRGNVSAVGGFSFFGGNDFGGGGKTISGNITAGKLPTIDEEKSKALHGRLKSQRDGTGGKLTVDPPFSFRRERGTGKI